MEGSHLRDDGVRLGWAGAEAVVRWLGRRAARHVPTAQTSQAAIAVAKGVVRVPISGGEGLDEKGMGMIKKLLVVLAVLAMLTTAVATPAYAGGKTKADVDLTLALYECPNADAPGPMITWAGIAKFKRNTLGIAFFPTAELEPVGDTGYLYFEENFTLFYLPKKKLTEKTLLAAACNPKRVILNAIDRGFGTPDDYWFGAGVITDARAHLRKWAGGTQFWGGTFTNDEQTTFGLELVLLRPGVH